jgi:hypothetical protein
VVAAVLALAIWLVVGFMHDLQKAREAAPNQRIEPMTSSAVRQALETSASGALLIMAHPHRWSRHEVTNDTA